MTFDETLAFLQQPITGVFTTLGQDGFPHSAGMWFVIDEPSEALLMWTYAKSQKALNVRRDPKASFLLESGVSYDELRGVLIRGEARLIEEIGEIESIGRRLYERYVLPRTGIAIDEGPGAGIARQAQKRVGISLPMARVASWDHSKA